MQVQWLKYKGSGDISSIYHILFRRIREACTENIAGEDWFPHAANPPSGALDWTGFQACWIYWVLSIVVWCFKVRFFRPEKIMIVSFTSMPLAQGIAPFPAKNQSFPPEKYVTTDRTWHYNPCPTGFVEVDMHSSFVTQMLESDHAFHDRVWWNLFPKKLNEMYKQQQGDNMGWCIHIVEGLNIAGLVWLCLLIFLLSGFVGIVYSAVTGDAGTAWTIASWFGTTVALSILCLQQLAKGVN
ncbi:hypothetical protein GGR51DRAFT_308416 [Nemania sp. FL0031]|nr:hypothetical protein GGR51DRAFT_308416 [Nemania sp. FL0031]